MREQPVALLLTGLVAAAYGATQGTNCPVDRPYSCGYNDRGCYSSEMSCNDKQECQTTYNGVSIDEMFCQKQVCSANKPYQCADGRGCYSPFEWCNGSPQCDDGSDEPQLECAIAWYLVYLAWEDFYIASLAAASQVFGKYYQPGCTLERPFQCDNYQLTGHCYGYNDWCNFKNDCTDGSDEHAQTCLDAWAIVWEQYQVKVDQRKQQTSQCTATQPFKCKNGVGCYSVSQFCNGVNDCGDQSDEPWKPNYECALWWYLLPQSLGITDDDKKRGVDKKYYAKKGFEWDDVFGDDRKRAVKRGFPYKKRHVKRPAVKRGFPFTKSEEKRCC